MFGHLHRSFRVARFAVAGLLLVAAAGCEATKNAMSAPTSSVVNLLAGNTFLAVGSSTTITVEIKGLDGALAPDGTEVLLTASQGTLDQRKLRLSGGRASVGYRAGDESGTVTITASSGNVSASMTLRVGSAMPGGVSLAVRPSSLPPDGGEAEVVATVTAADGAAVSGAPVVFKTSAGTVSPAEAVTDGQGQARTTLKTTSNATVSAVVDKLESPPFTVRLKAPVALTLSLSPNPPVAGQPATVTVGASSAGVGISGNVKVNFGDGRVADFEIKSGAVSVTHTWAREGSYDVSASFSHAEWGSFEWSGRLTVRSPSSPPSPSPTPGPSPPPSGGGDQIDPRSITIIGPNATDVMSWGITSQMLKVEASPSGICITHTKTGQWPAIPFYDVQIEGNFWIFAQFSGKWYGATFDYVRPGQVCKFTTAAEMGRDQIRTAPMDASWTPRAGDRIGIMASAPARYEFRSIRERSNVVVITWPY